MTMLSRRAAGFVLATLAGVSSHAAFAHEGHPHHDDAAAATSAPTPGAPRLALESAQAELVAIREPGMLVIYLDDHATNAPLSGLQVHALLGTHALEAAELAPGTYGIPDDLLDAAAANETTIRFQLHGPSIDESLEGELPPTATGKIPPARSDGPLIGHAALLAAGSVVVVIVLLALRRRRRNDIAA